jgi:hypothetical protein
VSFGAGGRARSSPRPGLLAGRYRLDAGIGTGASAHVQSEHFKQAQRTLPPHLAETPRIINFTIPQDGWSELGELAVPARD